MTKNILFLLIIIFLLSFFSCKKDITGLGEIKKYMIIYEESEYEYLHTSKIISIDTHGGNYQPLVDLSPLICLDPVVSPNGKKFLFLTKPSSDIYIYDFSSSTITNLTNSPEEEYPPTYSRDGLMIAYFSGPNLCVMDEDGGNKRILCQGDYISNPDFSPDGRSISYIKNSDLWIVNIDGTNNIKLYESWDGLRHFPIYSPQYSPDGYRIYFTEGGFSPAAGQTIEIYSINIDGSNKSQLTNTYKNYNYCIDPLGRIIAFLSERDRYSQIYVMDMNGCNQMNLTLSSNYEINPSFSPDGNYICYVSQNYDGAGGDIYVVKSDGSSKTNITKGYNKNGYYKVRNPKFVPSK